MWDGGWNKWKLVAKIDPDKVVTPETLDIMRDPGIDAVMVGGTQGITYSNTAGLVEKIRHSGYQGPLVQEISSAEAVVPGVDAHFIPVVLNAGDRRWLVDAHLAAIKKYGELVNWDRVVIEGYLVCNMNSAVGRLTGSVPVTAGDAAAYTVLAEEIFRLPIMYIEYSGIFGNPGLVRAVAGARKRIHLVYGGGIKSPGQVELVASLVDTVVIGNVLYDNPGHAREIVKLYRDMKGDWK